MWALCYKTLELSSTGDPETVKKWGVQVVDVPREILLEDVTTWDEHVKNCVQSWFRGGCVPTAWTQNDVTVWINLSNAVAV